MKVNRINSCELVNCLDTKVERFMCFHWTQAINQWAVASIKLYTFGRREIKCSAQSQWNRLNGDSDKPAIKSGVSNKIAKNNDRKYERNCVSCVYGMVYWSWWNRYSYAHAHSEKLSLPQKLVVVSSTTINDAIRYFRIFSLARLFFCSFVCSLGRVYLFLCICTRLSAFMCAYVYIRVLMYRHYYVIVASSSIHFAAIAINCRRKIKSFLMHTRHALLL